MSSRACEDVVGSILVFRRLACSRLAFLMIASLEEGP
jgi:hypothetical protein